MDPIYAERVRLLDLFCGAGGAAVGYHRAGFDEIVGVDVVPQPHYPFEFVQADAMTYPLDGFDLIHASPPCQAYSTLRHAPGGGEYPDLVELTRRRLVESGVPYVIENVIGAPLLNPITLCGSHFHLRIGRAVDSDAAELRRHRLFETSFPLMAFPCLHLYKTVLGVYGDLAVKRRPSTRGVKAGAQEARDLMEIDWMTDKELVQAIPPAYTEWIGREFLAE